MRTIILAALLASTSAPALAQEPPRAGPEPRPPVVDCSRPGMTHATRAGQSRPQRLAELPDAWRLHAVNRRVGGCAVHPEAQKVSSRTGRPAGSSR